MKYVIIGSGASGIKAAEDLRKLDERGEITVISEEKYYPYSKSLISRYLEGSLSERYLFYKTKKFFDDYKINGVLNKKIVFIDKKIKRVFSQDNEEFSYDKLLIATGAKPYLPEVEGLNLNGVYTFHCLDDARKVLKKAKESKRAVIIGAGFIGLECACSLSKIGLKVTVIEKCDQILPNQLDLLSSQIIQREIEGMGIEIILDESIISINGKRNVSSVTLGDKSEIQADMVIIATGVKPNREIAEKSEIKTDKGIIVDEYLMTSEPDIYAAGDVIEIDDIATGKRTVSATWFNAVLQGKYAAYNMAGFKKRFTNAIGIQNAAQFGEIPFISFGKTSIGIEEAEEYEVISIHKDKIYKKLVIKGNRICGMIFLGDISKSGFYNALIRNQIDISKYKHKLLDDDFSYSYFKEENFGEYNPYYEIPSCWESQHWWAHRRECIFEI